MLKICESIEQIVLLDGNSDYGLLCAASLATSPLLRAEQKITLINCSEAQGCGAAFFDQVQQTMRRSRMEAGKEGSLASCLPQQYFQGGVYPTSPEEVQGMLERIQIVPPGDGWATVRESPGTLWIMVLNADLAAGDTTEYVNTKLNRLVECLRGGAENCPAKPLILILDERCRRVIEKEDWPSKLRSTVLVHYTLTRELCGPALDYSLTLLYYMHPLLGSQNILSQFSLALLLGVSGHVHLKQSDKATFVPVDVALQVGLLTHFFYGKEKASTSVSVGVPKEEDGLVWGMLSEYVVNYGGRYVKQIKNVFESLNGAPEQVEAGEEKTNVAKPITIPNHFSEFIVQRPYAYFNLELKDLLSFGLSQTDIASCVNNKRAARRRVQLTEKLTSVEKGSGEAAARVSHVDRFRRLLELYDQNMQRQIRYTALNDYTKVTDTTNRNQKRDLRGPPFVITPLNTPPTVFNLHNYHHLLMRLTTHYTWNPILQYTAVHTIDYQMYIALIAQCALLLFFEDTFLPRSGTEGQQRLPSPMVQVLGQLPPLRYNFHNEFNFSEEFKGPEHPSRSRYWLGTGDWAMRIGKTSGGHLNKQSPGMHPARLAAILAQPNVRKFLVDYSLKEGVSQEVLEKRAKAILLRIGDTLSHRDLRTSGVIVRALLTNVYSRVNMEEFGYLRLRRLFQIPRTQIVLIPLHRSYVDFQIMSYLLGAMCLPYCHIVAGEDFLKMGKLADIMRGSGAFFMRRTFRGDPMYGLLFREYVRQLVLHQQTMEFFIEGTRSRTGKTMTPKLGILKFITDAFFGNGQNDLDDVLFVPVSLSYDELLEGGLYAKELLGVPKPPESITNMIKAGMALRGDLHGCINLRIGHTISLRRLSVHLDECPAPFQPRTELSKESPTPPAKSTTSPALLTRLGWRITYELQRNIVISPSALVASLLECLGPLEDTPDEKRSRMGTTCLTLSTLEKNVEWLKECIKARKGRLQDDVLSSSAARITTVGVTRLRKFAKLHTDGPFPHVTLHPKDSLVARVGVNISTNQLIHIFVDEALVSVVSHAYGNFTPVPSPSGHTNKKMPYGVRVVKKEVMENTCHWLQLMLATEFPNYSRYCPYSFDSWMSCVLHRMRTSGEEERQVLQQCGGEAGNGGAVVVPVTRLYYFTAQLLFPHIEALYVVLLTIEILFSTFKDSNRLPAKTVAAAAFNSYKLCFENSPSGDGEGSGGRLVEYIVAGNKETLQHYFQSAIELQFIRLVRGEGDTIFYALNDGRMEEGYGGKFQGQNGLERVARLIQQVQALRHHPSTEAGPKKKLQSIILEQYAKLTEGAKI